MTLPFRLYGLQRSCTSLMGYLALQNFDLEAREEVDFRHWFANHYPLDVDGFPLRAIVCVKNPYAWLDSMQRWCMSPITRRYLRLQLGLPLAEFLRHPCGDAIGPAAHWSTMIEHWVSLRDRHPSTTFLVQAEELYDTNGQRQVMRRLAKAWKLQPWDKKLFTESRKMAARFEATDKPMDVGYYEEQRYLDRFTDADLALVNEQLRVQLMTRFGYEWKGKRP